MPLEPEGFSFVKQGFVRSGICWLHPKSPRIDTRRYASPVSACNFLSVSPIQLLLSIARLLCDDLAFASNCDSSMKGENDPTYASTGSAAFSAFILWSWAQLNQIQKPKCHHCQRRRPGHLCSALARWRYRNNITSAHNIATT